MAQCEHKRLGVTLTDSQQKQPAQQEKGGHCDINIQLTQFYGCSKKKKKKVTLLFVFYSYSMDIEGKRTRLLVPAGG